MIDQSFERQFAAYRDAINKDIAVYGAHVRKTTEAEYGPNALLVTDAYLNLLNGTGKRLRGMLTMLGYELCGGQDRTMITRAATAMEMLHAYILIIDDIQDQSVMRRGKPTVHEQLAKTHAAECNADDAGHRGVSLALNAALSGAHAAQMLLAGLSVDPELRAKVLGIISHTMIVTAHGQTRDILQECAKEVSDADIAQTSEWKSAHYTFLNPLCVGMVLAGAGCEDTDAIREYALHAGRAFQTADDIAGVFLDDEGLDNDIAQGTRTLLVNYALEHTTGKEKQFLQDALGNRQLSAADLGHCRAIMTACGALEHVTAVFEEEIDAAIRALDTHPDGWNATTLTQLRDLLWALEASVLQHKSA